MVNDQYNEFDKMRLTILDSIAVNRNLTIDNELTSFIYVGDEIPRSKNLRFN